MLLSPSPEIPKNSAFLPTNKIGWSWRETFQQRDEFLSKSLMRNLSSCRHISDSIDIPTLSQQVILIDNKDSCQLFNYPQVNIDFINSRILIRSLLGDSPSETGWNRKKRAKNSMNEVAVMWMLIFQKSGFEDKGIFYSKQFVEHWHLCVTFYLHSEKHSDCFWSYAYRGFDAMEASTTSVKVLEQPAAHQLS